MYKLLMSMLMKMRCLCVVLAGIAVGTAGCQKQDGAPVLDKAEVRLYVGENVQLTADRSVTWSSADDFIAAVNGGGNVTAAHVGVTTVTATSDSCSTSCVVNVQPRYSTLEEPHYELLLQHSSVLETADLGEVLYTDSDKIAYRGAEPFVDEVQYWIRNNDGVIHRINVVINDITYEEELVNFLGERYEYYPVSDPSYYQFLNYYQESEKDEKDLTIVLSPYADHLYLMYLPVSRN